MQGEGHNEFLPFVEEILILIPCSRYLSLLRAKNTYCLQWRNCSCRHIRAPVYAGNFRSITKMTLQSVLNNVVNARWFSESLIYLNIFYNFETIFILDKSFQTLIIL